MTYEGWKVVEGKSNRKFTDEKKVAAAVQKLGLDPYEKKLLDITDMTKLLGNSFFLNANSSNKPGIVDADRNPTFEQSEVYSGVYGRASINFYAFNTNGNKGIQARLL